MGGGREAGRGSGVELRPPDPGAWQGRVDPGEGPRALRWHQEVRLEGLPAIPRGAAPPIAPEPLLDFSDAGEAGATALVGFACEAGVVRNGGRPGAAAGPTALRRALAGMAWHGGPPVLDVGDVAVLGDALEAGQGALSRVVSGLLERGWRPLVLGGGHETALGAIRGLVDHLERGHPSLPPVLGVLNLDAHLDLRRSSRPTSGTSFRDAALLCQALGWEYRYLCVGVAATANTAALFDTVRELGGQWVPDLEATPTRLAEVLATVRGFQEEVDHLHLSVDLDVLPGWVAPGVSAPAAPGVDPSVVLGVVREVLAGDRLRSVDISELSPPHDIDGRTARMAARLAWILAGGGS